MATTCNDESNFSDALKQLRKQIYLFKKSNPCSMKLYISRTTNQLLECPQVVRNIDFSKDTIWRLHLRQIVGDLMFIYNTDLVQL